MFYGLVIFCLWIALVYLLVSTQVLQFVFELKDFGLLKDNLTLWSYVKEVIQNSKT